MKHPLVRVLAVFIVVGLTSAADASIEIGDRIKFNNGIGSPGGAFLVDNLTDLSEPQLATFCVEITEYINFTDTYAVEDIGNITKNGGKTLSSYAAWLYNSFLDGTLSSFSSSSVSDMNTLQLAIWKQMSYTDLDIKTHIGTAWFNMYNPILIAKPWDAAFAGSGWVGTGSVAIMNLQKVDSQGNMTSVHAQDQIVRLDSPEPVSFLVWSMLALCIGSMTARRRSNDR